MSDEIFHGEIRIKFDGNGIHGYTSTDVKNLDRVDFEMLKAIHKLVTVYNEEQIEHG